MCSVTNVDKDGKKDTTLRKLNEFSTFIRSNKAVAIVKKVNERHEPSMADQVLSRRPFGLDSNIPFDNDGDVILRSSAGMGKIRFSRITSGLDIVDKWKIIVSKVSFEHAGTPDKNNQMRVLSVIQKLPPHSACTESYLVVGSFDTEEEADKLMSYLKTKFVRFLIMQMLASMNMSKASYTYVPAFTKDTRVTDQELYKQYSLTSDEVNFIESSILPYPDK